MNERLQRREGKEIPKMIVVQQALDSNHSKMEKNGVLQLLFHYLPHEPFSNCFFPPKKILLNNTTDILCIYLCTTVLWRATNHCSIQIFCLPTISPTEGHHSPWSRRLQKGDLLIWKDNHNSLNLKLSMYLAVIKINTGEKYEHLNKIILQIFLSIQV